MQVPEHIQQALSLVEQGRGAEAVDHFLDRVDRFSDQVGAFITVTADAAREAARAATERFHAGDDLPPLYGVPTGIKDLNLTAGVRTTLGSQTYAPPLRSPLASICPSGLNSIAVTQSVCFLILRFSSPVAVS